MAEASARARSDAWIWVLVVAATASVIALAIVQSRHQQPPPSSQPAPSLSLPLLDGGKAATIEAGRVTVVDFWATWCVPCRASMPRVEKLWQEYQPRGLKIYSVDTDDPSPDREPQVREFLLKNRLTFPVVLDDGSGSEAFSVASIPTMVLVDKRGQVAWSHVGALTGSYESDLRAAIDRALATN